MSLDILPHPFHKLEDIISVHLVETDHEFLTTGTGNQRPFADEPAQDSGKLLQDGIARRVTVSIVHRFEVIDIANSDPAGYALFACESAL